MQAVNTQKDTRKAAAMNHFEDLDIDLDFGGWVAGSFSGSVRYYRGQITEILIDVIKRDSSGDIIGRSQFEVEPWHALYEPLHKRLTDLYWIEIDASARV